MNTYVNIYHCFLRSRMVNALGYLCAAVLFFTPLSFIYSQDEEYYEEDPDVEVFWGDEGDEYYEEGDEYLDEEGYYEEDEYYDEGDEYYDEFEDESYEGEEEDYGYDEEFGEFEEYADDEFVEGEELSDTELADLAQRMGFTINLSGASPGFVNNALTTYNSSVDYRLSVEFPMLMQLVGVRFRFGAEIGTFGFENYLPVGGKFSGATILGILSFPAGPGNVKTGLGMVGGNFGFTAETTYGFNIQNVLDVRAGVRSTTAFNAKDTKKNKLGTVGWMDGLITLGITL